MSDFLITNPTESGYNSIALKVSYGFIERDQIRKNYTRALGGTLRAYEWAKHKQFSVPLTYLNSSDTSRINQWWRDNNTLDFTLNSSLDQNTVICRMVNQELPIGQIHKSYTDQFFGSMQLEAIDASSFVGKPFILDDAVLGLLDQSYNPLR